MPSATSRVNTTDPWANGSAGASPSRTSYNDVAVGVMGHPTAESVSSILVDPVFYLLTGFTGST